MPARTRPPVTDALTWASFLATALALAGGIALHARWLPPMLLGAFGLLIAVRLWMRHRGLGRVPALVRLGIAIALVAALAFTLGGIFGREAGSALLAAMMSVKLVEAETRRDARVILAVTAFLAMASFLFDQGMLQVAMVAGACVLLLAAMYELEPGTPREDRGAAQRLYSARGLREAARHLALAVPFAVVCFMLFPRLSSPLWGAPQDAFSGRTGISDRMEPGALASLALDDTVAMRVRFEGAPPPPQDRYWRGLVLWSFDGKAWGAPDAARAWRQPPAVEALGPAVEYEVTLEPTDQRWLFLLDAPLAAPDGASLSSDLQASERAPVTRVKRYRGRSAPRHRNQTDLPHPLAMLARRIPEQGNPLARAMAERWRDETGGETRTIARRALALYNADFTYSFEVPLLGADPIDDFLFGIRTGWCEHFASSFVFLMRAAGVPARVVVGFQGGLWNRAGGYLAVRRSDAHAWAEIWIAGDGWVRVDPTSAVAPERVSRDARAALDTGATWAPQGWLAALRERVDLVGFWWNDAVVQFSALNQRVLFEDAGLDPDELATRAGALLGAAVLALALAAALAGRRRRRDADPLREAWRAWCARLAGAGVVRGANEGPLAFGTRAAAALPAQAGAIRALATGYAGLRYAVPAPDPRAAAAWRRAARSFRVR